MENNDNNSLNDDLNENEFLENEENEEVSEENEEVPEEIEEENSNVDYSSILQEMNIRLENIESYTLGYNEGINGILTNLYFLDFVGFTVFIFLMLFVVIKFFKQFF